MPGTLDITPSFDYPGALSYVDDIGTVDRGELDERETDRRFRRNSLLLKIKNGGMKLPAGVK